VLLARKTGAALAAVLQVAHTFGMVRPRIAVRASRWRHARVAGLPAALATAFAAFDSDTARGLYAVTSDAVARFSGRPPTTVAEFLAGQQLSAAA